MCTDDHSLGITSIGDGRSEDIFTQGGFTDWKHALNKFEIRERSKSHKFAQSQLTQFNRGQPINAQINDETARDQIIAQKELLV